MGETLSLYRQTFQLAPEHEDDALRALQAARGRGASSGEWSAADPDQKLAASPTLEAALGALGFGVRRDGRGYIIGISCVGEVPGAVEGLLFPPLAPYVEEESFVDLIAHPDEGLVRYRFDGKTYVRRHVRISAKAWVKYVDTHEQELEAAEQRAKPVPPAWAQVSGAIPSSMPDYSPGAKPPRGSWLRHAKFGPGYVVADGDGKIRVLFESGERTLASQR
jgi:hypothetical protein